MSKDSFFLTAASFTREIEDEFFKKYTIRFSNFNWPGGQNQENYHKFFYLLYP